jgi:hypothetical protein
MKMILSRAAHVTRTGLSFTAPALVLGLVLISQVQARINYPPGPAGRIERTVDNILIKTRADILRQAALVNQQNVVNARIGILQQQISQTTDPNVLAVLQRQLLQRQTQFLSLQLRIDRNALVLRRNLDVLFPQKDRLLVVLNTLPRPRNQIRQFTESVRLQQATYAAVMRAFLGRRPLSPVTAF